MTDHKKTSIRLATIFARLNEGQTVNVAALAEEFGVTKRTIQIDLNKRLGDMYNIVDKGHGNYAFEEGYRIKPVENEEETIAVSLMKSLQQHAVPEFNEYVNAAIPMVKYYEKLFLFDLHFETIEDIGTFRIILRAIQWRVGLEFLYTNHDGVVKEVTVHPYRIANFKSFWYLVAYDLLDEKIKVYYLKNITKLHLLDENFIADENIEEELDRICSTIDSAWYSDETFYVTLNITGEANRYLSRNLPNNLEILEEKENATLVRMRYHDESEVLTLVKTWLPDIEIVDNELLQKKLKRVLDSYLHRINI